jgi:hypothetical protein
VGRGRVHITIWRMRIACWIPKATNTRSEYEILTAFPLQQWLYEHASMLLCTYIGCRVSYKIWQFEGIRPKIIATVESTGIEIN